ncbi:hypothetical protein AB1Y20_002798 [Prymnesium parvum]|uniref:Mannosyltransferase n=1 Tax=Prymnesium parvum TaxID=97485 RepID=A0AB34JAK6_PRYPA
MFCKREEVVRMCADMVRMQMALFYLGAGLWKINDAFLDARVSCASIYVASLVSYLPEQLVPHWINLVLTIAPHITIIGECGLGICLLLPSRGARRIGVSLSALLHYGIAITPHPNQVASFGVFCVTRLFFVMPEAWTTALQECLTLPASTAEYVARLGSVVLIAASTQLTSTPGVYIDWCIPVQTALCLLVARACLIDVQTKSHDEARSTTSTSIALRAGGVLLLLLTLSYAFVFQVLGLMDISATSPFSSIRQHGGTNHRFMPTSLLQQSQITSQLDKFGGGVVRVTACSSEYMNALYPANCTEELPPRVRQLLLRAGHIGQQFNPTVRQMLGPEIRADLPRWRRGSGVPFPAYTVPALQLRRMLAEARSTGERFTLEYEHLPGVVGDEAWRQTAVAAHVRVDVEKMQVRRCRVRRTASLLWTRCSPQELALLPAPEGPLMKIMLFFPYPIIRGLDVLPCMD